MPSAARSYWMVVTSPANYERTKALRFTQQGVKRRYRHSAERMRPGDGLCFFVTGAGTFAAIAVITAPYFESKKRIWVSDGTPDLYPWRVKTKKQRAVAPESGVPASSLAPKLKFVRKWPKAHWRLAFQGNLHELPAEDFQLIARAVAGA